MNATENDLWSLKAASLIMVTTAIHGVDPSNPDRLVEALDRDDAIPSRYDEVERITAAGSARRVVFNSFEDVYAYASPGERGALKREAIRIVRAAASRAV